MAKTPLRGSSSDHYRLSAFKLIRELLYWTVVCRTFWFRKLGHPPTKWACLEEQLVRQLAAWGGRDLYPNSYRRLWWSRVLGRHWHRSLLAALPDWPPADLKKYAARDRAAKQLPGLYERVATTGVGLIVEFDDYGRLTRCEKHSSPCVSIRRYGPLQSGRGGRSVYAGSAYGLGKVPVVVLERPDSSPGGKVL